MRTVKLRLRPFAAMMMTARRWLDAHGVLPSVFHDDNGDDKMLVIRIQFAVDDEAEVFDVRCRVRATRMRAWREEEEQAR